MNTIACKKSFKKLAIIFTGVLFMSCASTTKAEIEPKEIVVQNLEPSTNGLGITDEKYQRSLSYSILSLGNNYLLKNVIEKLRAGEEEVCIAAIGGSVTEGAGPAKYTDGYAYKFAEQIKSEYAKAPEKVKFDGAGIGGTPSIMGLIRYEKDVVQVLGREPDLLLIEFAVNDWQECSNTRGFEHMIRHALENNVAVIVVYAAATYGNQQNVMSPVANFYCVPQVSISNALDYSGINAERDSKIYYTDMVHPTANGHMFMVNCIMDLMSRIDKAEKNDPFEIPSDYRNRNAFTSFKTIYGNTNDSNVSINCGGFDTKDTVIQNYMKGGKSFPENWKHTETSSNEPFTMELKCKSLFMVFKNSSAQLYGKVDVYVDGKLVKQFDGYDKGGWNNCNTVIILDNPQVENHKIEVKMAQEDSKKCFTILAFGYSL